MGDLDAKAQVIPSPVRLSSSSRFCCPSVLRLVTTLPWKPQQLPSCVGRPTLHLLLGSYPSPSDSSPPPPVPSGPVPAASSVVSESTVSWAAGALAVLRCQSPRMVWTQDRLHDRQRVVHWDLSGRPAGGPARRLVDMYSAGEQRVYEPRDRGRLQLPLSAFHDGNFSLLIRGKGPGHRGGRRRAGWRGPAARLTAGLSAGPQRWRRPTRACTPVTCTTITATCTRPWPSAWRSRTTVSVPPTPPAPGRAPAAPSPPAGADPPAPPAREAGAHWDGEKDVLLVERGAPALLTCVNRAHVWTDRHLEEAQQVVHWDRQPPGVPHDRADRLLDLYASGERRAYGPPFLRDRVAVGADAFARGDFSLRIDPLEPADEGTYSCHLHHHYCGLHERRIFHLRVTEPVAEPPPRDSPGNGSSHSGAPGPGAAWPLPVPPPDLGVSRGEAPSRPSPPEPRAAGAASIGCTLRGSRARSLTPPPHGPCRSHPGARPQRHQRHSARGPGPLLPAAGLRAGHPAPLHPAAHHRHPGHPAASPRR